MAVQDPVAGLNASLEGRYHVQRELAEGGMARVYLADDLRHRRSVAVKVLRPELSAAVGTERFLAEIRTTAHLQHPHILPLFDSGEADGLLFYVMPYVSGESLRARLDREGPLPVEEAVDLASTVASTLHYAHEQGVIHRDVKPANIMLSAGIPIVADFGIALAVQSAGESRLTRSGSSVGTPKYASPEQSTGDGPVDARSDVYSLACVLYEMLTGELPHTARSAQALVAKRLTTAPTPVNLLRAAVPGHVAAALRRALQPVPADRFQSAAEFLEALVPGEGSGPAHADPWMEAPEPVARPETLFVGREKERADLVERLDAAMQGRGSLVLLAGEPGVGKTRLSEYLIGEARQRNFMCVVGHAYELEGTPPFTPFIEQLEYTARVVPPDTFRAVLGDAAPEIARLMPALRRQFPDIGPAIELPGDQVRHYLFHRYREFAERATRVAPLVVFFDDLHWADEGSLLLLEHLTHHLHGLSMLAIGTYREAELEVGRPFASSLERLLRQHNVHRVSLKPMSEPEVERFLAALGGSAPPPTVVRKVFAETEGNPFFVQEVFRHLSEEGRLFDPSGDWIGHLGPEDLVVPESVRLVVGRRLERISEEARQALTTAAVVGPKFSLSVVEGADPVDPERLIDAMEEAEAAQLIRSEPAQRDATYRFTHELIRQTLLDTISVPRRQRRHVRIAAAFQSAFQARIEDHASDVAYHLYEAGAAAGAEETLRFLRLAGDQALARSGYEDALAQYERALSLEEEVPGPLRPVLMEGKVNALVGMGRPAEAVELGTRALELYADVGDSDGIARLASLVCYRLSWLVRDGEAAEVGQRALSAITDAPGPYRARLKCRLGVALDLAERAGSEELIEDGIAEARASGDVGALLESVLSLKIWQYHRGRLAEAVELDPESLRLLQGSVEQRARLDLLWLQALLLPLLGRLEEATGAISESRALAEECNDTGVKLNAAFGALWAEGIRSGDGRVVEARGRELAEEFRRVRWARAGLFFAGLGRLWQGDTDGAVELMEYVSETGEREPRLWNGLSAGWWFRTAAYAEREDAYRLYEAAVPRILRRGRRAYPGDGFGLHAVIEGLAVHGDIEAAALLYEDAVASLDTGTAGHMDGLWACTSGIAAACGERWAAAEVHFREALRQADEIPHTMARNDGRRWWAWMLLRRRGEGDREQARRLLGEAIGGYEELGARLFERLARGMLADT